ncbi:MAG: tRNA 5-methoxyuridine(34)/uridine 5-oxyacetic acid(34) synthase CmoB [Congregibacter sp.]
MSELPLIDTAMLKERWADSPLSPWLDVLETQIAAGLSTRRYGDIPRWRSALESLPDAPVQAIDLQRAEVSVDLDLVTDGDAHTRLLEGLRGLRPWRKGPYRLGPVAIDTEWRSDWKWDRLIPHIDTLSGRRVLDVGCGNGYHCWRMRGAGASEVIGIDPTPLFVFQFAALQRYINDPWVQVLPMGIEALPDRLFAFDTVFSMGVLYHRRSPMEHLRKLRDALRPGGQLVLETLVIAGDEQRCLVPEGRYSRMGNVWFLPSSAMLLVWLRKLGWQNPRLVDESVTTVDEQRATDWMSFYSLRDFLDPEDPSKTVEGYPAPRRAILIAESAQQ